MKLYQLNFPGIGLDIEEEVSHPVPPKLSPAKSIVAYCIQCCPCPDECTKTKCKLWPHSPSNKPKKGKV